MRDREGRTRGGTAPPPRWQHSTPRRQNPSPVAVQTVIRLLRFVLPTLAVGLVVLAIFWPQIFPARGPVGLDVASVERDPGSGEEAMVDATYSGVDRQGRPFSVFASRVQSAPQGNDVLKLTQPSAQIAMRDGGTAAIVAEAGIYDRSRQSLELTGDVTLTRAPDLRVRTSQATIDLDAGSASGHEPVRGEAAFGTVEGTGFEVQDRGERVVVGGPATLHIRPGAEARLR